MAREGGNASVCRCRPSGEGRGASPACARLRARDPAPASAAGWRSQQVARGGGWRRVMPRTSGVAPPRHAHRKSAAGGGERARAHRRTHPPLMWRREVPFAPLPGFLRISDFAESVRRTRGRNALAGLRFAREGRCRGRRVREGSSRWKSAYEMLSHDVRDNAEQLGDTRASVNDLQATLSAMAGTQAAVKADRQRCAEAARAALAKAQRHRNENIVRLRSPPTATRPRCLG